MSVINGSSFLEQSRAGVVNIWQRGVPVFERKVWTPHFIFLCLVGLAGIGLMVWRLLSGQLGLFTGLNDAYAWGVWKTVNVMALTALGSGGMAVGVAAWFLFRKRLHSVMRVALMTSFLFYFAGMVGLLVDMGRPWNIWNAFLPWRWNTESALWEVSVAMPLYCFFFLAYENSPTVVERFWYTGSPKTRAFIERWRPRMRRIYPYMIAGAYVTPMMHQSSLGALMTLAGDKVYGLWQSPLLPGLYLFQAAICGFAFVIVCVMGACLVYRRPLDMGVLGELASLMSWLILGWLFVRVFDLAARDQMVKVFKFDTYSILFLAETLLILLPAVAFRSPRIRSIPQALFLFSVVACIGGLLYRFIPTTVAYDPGSGFKYFPSVIEVLIMLGLGAAAFAAFTIALKLFAILPAPLKSWYEMVDISRRLHPEMKRDEHGNPIDD